MGALVVNLFGGPGCGKSTAAALLFGKLKQHGINCEMALEYAKDKVWEESLRTLDDQIYIFGKQLHKIWRLNDKVDVIITDSPLLFSIIYDKENNIDLKYLVISTFNRFNNFNCLLRRQTEYQQEGRYQNETEAKQLDEDITNLLEENDILYQRYENIDTNVDDIFNDIIKLL